ncbi:MAG TPA: metalloregulator ArsR/SmtB family transcription factor [Acidobacteriaceae bacterium]|nr:metalloregulator ArsR/SmtB family transcription factor [Acidobacteriaceae bacterium]
MVELRTAASPAAPGNLDLVFHALADATRRAILHEITHGERSVGELAQPHAMSLAAVSKHLDVLERASLIQRRRSGQHRFVRLNPRPLAAAQDWLAFYRQFWSANLDRLQELLESPHPPKSVASKRTHRRTVKEK